MPYLNSAPINRVFGKMENSSKNADTFFRFSYCYSSGGRSSSPIWACVSSVSNGQYKHWNGKGGMAEVNILESRTHCRFHFGPMCVCPSLSLSLSMCVSYLCWARCASINKFFSKNLKLAFSRLKFWPNSMLAVTNQHPPNRTTIMGKIWLLDFVAGAKPE